MDLKLLTVALNRYLVDPICKTVDHVGQLDFSKRTGGSEVKKVDLKDILWT